MSGETTKKDEQAKVRITPFSYRKKFTLSHEAQAVADANRPLDRWEYNNLSLAAKVSRKREARQGKEIAALLLKSFAEHCNRTFLKMYHALIEASSGG
jgi:hypothetical protein